MTPPAQWLENSLRYSVDNSDASRPGGETVLAKLSEVLFIETLRRYIELFHRNRPAGWRAFEIRKSGKPWRSCISQPARPWTIASLAAEIGMSRSVLAERFRQYLSETPMAYLARWRLQLGAQMLNPRAAVLQRSLLRSATSRNPPLIVPSNGSLGCRRPDSVASREQPAAPPPRLPWRTVDHR